MHRKEKLVKIQSFWKWILTKDVCGLYTDECRSNVNFVDEKKNWKNSSMGKTLAYSNKPAPT